MNQGNQFGSQGSQDFKLFVAPPRVSEDALTAWAIVHLRERGYHVTAPNEKWETPTQFNRRLGIGHEGLRRALRRPGCPNVAIAWSNAGRGKRILQLLSNPAFDAFVLRHKQHVELAYR